MEASYNRTADGSGTKRLAYHIVSENKRGIDTLPRLLIGQTYNERSGIPGHPSSSGNVSITFKVPKATESDEKCTEAYVQKPEVHFPEVKRP